MGTPRVPIRGLRSGPLELPEEAARHLVRVLRLDEGDAFTAFDPDAGTEAAGVITAVTKGATHARIDLVRARPERPRIFWLHGLPKGDKPEQIVQDATELGVTSMCFAVCDRSVPKLNAVLTAAKVKRWQTISVEAARQCGRARSAEVRIERNFEDALLWATANSPRSSRVCFHPGAKRFEVGEATGELIFAVGPEGGFSDREIALAEQDGFAIRSLGDLVLRTETVPAAVLGAMMLR